MLIKKIQCCLISFFNLYELFPAFIRTNNIVGLVNNLFGVRIFNLFPSFISSSSISNSSIGGTSLDFSLSVDSPVLNHES